MSQKRLRLTTRTLVFIFGILTLLIPILVFFFVRGKVGRLINIYAAIGIFGSIVIATTIATNAELLASLAA